MKVLAIPRRKTSFQILWSWSYSNLLIGNMKRGRLYLSKLLIDLGFEEDEL